MQKQKKSDKIDYYSMITSRNKNFTFRKRMVLKALEIGIKPTAREFSTTAKTVRKWRNRFKQYGHEGLCELSRRPLSSPKKTPEPIEQAVVQQRIKTPGFGARRLVEEFNLPVSHNVANRIIKAHKLTRPRRKKHHKKNDLRKVKANYEAFTRFQMDTKHLRDLPKYWAQAQYLGLPWYQYTIRELSTGAQFLTYSQELSKTYATLTVERFLKHLQRFDIDTKKVIIKTDLGIEFDGDTEKYRPEGFHKTIEKTGAKHLFNPPASPNFNADVESVHATIENEFFEAEAFLSRDDFNKKVTTYQFWYNCARKNSSRKWKSPADILSEKNPKINPQIFLLHPVFCETLFDPLKGYLVPGLTEKIFFWKNP